ncbi:hypothetical protein EUGRSUZ_A01399 [Eucalyptus grandis]|uniref:Uncharacterized protein n=2 Tax=Eucalyptus grandis TaxID=71139 RepID=A0ACC3M3K5_EUCGR|nr:hypothetical protein EUGRSUZ_A01399 [Eucalyptus grandis]
MKNANKHLGLHRLRVDSRYCGLQAHKRGSTLDTEIIEMVTNQMPIKRKKREAELGHNNKKGERLTLL